MVADYADLNEPEPAEGLRTLSQQVPLLRAEGLRTLIQQVPLLKAEGLRTLIQDMTPFSMDTGSDSNSPDSPSTAGSEKEGESHQRGNRGRKRKQKNRHAARKSRRKQTERADELHEELQCLERSNAALQKEIAALKKDLRLYTSALGLHEPLCRLRISSASPPARLPSCPSPAAAPLPADLWNCSSAASTPLQTSCSSTSLTSSQPECVHLSSSSPAPTRTTSNSPPQTFSSPTTSPASFCAAPSYHSHLAPVCTAPPPHSSASTNALDSVLCSSSRAPPSVPHSAILDAPLSEQVSISSSSLHPTPTIVSTYFPILPPIEGNTSQAAQDCPINAPQLHTGQFSGTAADSNSLCTLLPSFHQSRAHQSLSISRPTNQGACAALDLAFNPTHYPSSLLSLFAVPSPPDPPQNTSSTLTGPLYQPSRDLSLSELLEGNDWILDGSGNQ